MALDTRDPRIGIEIPVPAERHTHAVGQHSLVFHLGERPFTQDIGRFDQRVERFDEP